MGAVLEMSLTMRSLAALGLAAALAACSNAPVDTLGNDYLKSAFHDVGTAIKGPPEQPPLSAAMLKGVTTPLLYVELPSRKVWAGLPAVARNQGAITWVSPDQIGVTTKSGVLFATRGLGADLLSADTSGTLAALSGRSDAGYPKIYRRLGGDESIVADEFYCKMVNEGTESRTILGIVHPATRMRESCYAMKDERRVTNMYWIGADGTMWDSVQWVSPEIGYATIRYLAPPSAG